MNKWMGGLLMAMALGNAQAAPTAPELASLDATVERVRQTFNVPGIAVAVVKDGQVVMARGWGVREVGKPAAVDADTLLRIRP